MPSVDAAADRVGVETSAVLTEGEPSWSKRRQLSVLDLGPYQLSQKLLVSFLSAHPEPAQASGQGLGYSYAFKCFSVSVAAVGTHSAKVNSF